MRGGWIRRRGIVYKWGNENMDDRDGGELKSEDK